MYSSGEANNQRVMYAYTETSKSQTYLKYTAVAIVVLLLFVVFKISSDAPRVVGYQDRTNFDGSYSSLPIAIVTDLDHDSKIGDYQWHARLKQGTLKIDTSDAKNPKYSVSFGDEVQLKSLIGEKGRGMELSELQEWNGELLTVDDRTGIVYAIKDKLVFPRYILHDVTGSPKGYKGEWMTVKDGILYVGSMGKEWTHPETGEVKSNNPMYVYTIDSNGHVEAEDWRSKYNILREKVNAVLPGYMIHEAVTFDPRSRNWYFFPRRVSSEIYTEKTDLTKGSNHIIIADENFSTVQVKRIGEVKPLRGFSSAKPIPGRPGEFVVLKSEEEENEANQRTFLSVVDTNNDRVLLDDVLVGDVKFEGIEFLWENLQN